MQKTDQELSSLLEQLQSFLAWGPEDEVMIAPLKQVLEPVFPDLVEDFYSEIDRHDATRSIIASSSQRARLKKTLQSWLQQLLGGQYDLEFVKSRWRVGHRHVEIQLDQTYATAALGRLRWRMHLALSDHYRNDPQMLAQAVRTLNKLLDMDCAIINAAYQLNFARQLERTAQNQMQQSERLAAIGQMVTGLAHESRNALQRSHACLETLVLDIDDRPDALSLVRRVQSALDHLHTLYEEVRNYAAPIKLDRQEIALGKLANSCWVNLQHKWQPLSIQFHIDMPVDAILLQADRRRLDQVLTNLLQNAIDACGPEGRINLSIVAQDQHVELEIHDDGEGIRLNPPDRVFEPFLTTKTKGTGLGLAIAKRIIEAHHGTISVENLPTQGACFRIQLPVDSLTPDASRRANTHAD